MELIPELSFEDQLKLKSFVRPLPGLNVVWNVTSGTRKFKSECYAVS